jgi:hypothetical protein
MVIAFQTLITCNKSALPSPKDSSQNESFFSSLSKSFSYWTGEASEKSDTVSRAGTVVTSALSGTPEQEGGHAVEALSTPERLKRSQRVVESKDAPSKRFFLTPHKSSLTESSSPTTIPLHTFTNIDSPTSVPMELNLSESWNTPTANSVNTWEEFERTPDFDKFTDTFKVTYENQASRWLRNGKDESSPCQENLSPSVPEFEDFRRRSLKALSGSTQAEI